MKPKFSIIIPHYNASDTIDQLLKSIFENADLTEIETIVVDDRSNPACLEGLKKIIKNRYENKVQLFENNSVYSGAGAARNIGLKNATGEWIIFADADDLFLDNFYDIVTQDIDDSYDVIFYPPASIDEDGNENLRINTYLKYFNNYFETKDEAGLRYSFVQVWSRVYKRQFLEAKNIRFETVNVANDVLFSLKVGIYAEFIKVKKEPIYCWKYTANSLTTKIDKEKFKQRIAVAINANKYFYKSVPSEIFKANRKTISKQVAIALFRYKMGLRYTVSLIFQLRKAKFGFFKLSDFSSFKNFFRNNKYYK